MTQGGLGKFILLLLFLLCKLEEEMKKKSKYRETNRAKGKREGRKESIFKTSILGRIISLQDSAFLAAHSTSYTVGATMRGASFALHSFAHFELLSYHRYTLFELLIC